MGAENDRVEAQPDLDPHMLIEIEKNGPYIVHGGVPLKGGIITPVGGHYEMAEGEAYPYDERYVLCRCGETSTPPFCDGAHLTNGFDGTETASHTPYRDRAQVFVGEGLELLDDKRCAYARFCHRDDGNVWSLTESSGDEHCRAEAIKASSMCPSGRLVHLDSEGKPLEPELKPEIVVMEDPEQGVSSALFVKGGIPLESADGELYERRNRYALCRCGHSRNMPYCDAAHVNIRFKA